jgi:hypothetical protein
MAGTKSKKKNDGPYFKWGVSFLLLLIVAFLAQAYLLPPDKVIGERIIKFLPLPAAFVNADAVLLGNYYDRVKIAQKVENGSAINSSAILDQLINNKIAELIAKTKDVNFSNQDLETSYSNLQRSTGQQILGADYNLTESEFKKEIIEPDLIKTKLQIYLASNNKLNSQVYKNLDQAKTKLLAGASFDKVAAEYSDDARSAKIGGDLGFISYNDFIPEVYNALDQIKDKDAHVIVSRLGVHIVQVTAKDNNGPKNTTRYHLKQIYFKTTDYQKWFEKQKSFYSILKLVH